MNRQKAPEIEVILVMTKQLNVMIAPNNEQVVNQQNPKLYSLNVYIENVGKIYAKYINLVLTLPNPCLNKESFFDQYKGNTIIQLDNKVRDLVEPPDERRSMISLSDHNKPKQYGPARHEPLLPGMRMMLKSIEISKEAFEPGNTLSWTVYADNAEPKTGKVAFLAI